MENKPRSKEDIKREIVLESKLNFLHHCLTPDGLSNAELKPEWKAQSEFDKLKEANDGPFGENYITALRTLRDKLLES